MRRGGFCPEGVLSASGHRDVSQRQPVSNDVTQWLFTRRCFLFSHRHAHSPLRMLEPSPQQQQLQQRRLAASKRTNESAARWNWATNWSSATRRRRIGIQRRVVAIIGLLARDWATRRQCYKEDQVWATCLAAHLATAEMLGGEYKFTWCRRASVFQITSVLLQRLFP